MPKARATEILSIDGVQCQLWYLSPIKLPVEAREACEEQARKERRSLVEFVLVAVLERAGYDEESIRQISLLCYPKNMGVEPKEDPAPKRASDPEPEPNSDATTTEESEEE